MSNERSRDFGGPQSRGFDHVGADRRDPGEEALLELARLIGSHGDSLSSEPSEPRLSDVSRVVASQEHSYDDPGFEPRHAPSRGPAVIHHDVDWDGPRMLPPPHPDSEPPAMARASVDFDFSALSGRDAYTAAPRLASAGERGLVIDSPRSGPRHDEYHGYADEDYDPDHGEDFEEEHGERRRTPTRVIMAVLGLAVFGSAAAYGYRTMVSGAPSGPTPIIRADNSPTRITPMSEVKQEGGQIGNRISERLVRRDEDPVDINASPSYGAGGNDADGSASDVTPAVATPASPRDPKRVQTVPIRVEQGTASSSADRAASRAAAVTAPPAAVPPAPSRQTAAPPVRQAAVSAPVDPPAVVPAGAGGFVVQIAAVRSEADAQTAFRQVQAKYPVLSGRQPLIRRKDQGERGVFFAAQVGPFGAKGDADQLCEQLKTAGGSCFVQRN